MNVALTALAGSEIEFQVGVAARDLSDMFEGAVAERSASEIGVQDDAGGVDDGTQGVGQPSLQALFDSARQLIDRSLEREFVERVPSNLETKVVMACAMPRRGPVAELRGQNLQLFIAQ